MLYYAKICWVVHVYSFCYFICVSVPWNDAVGDYAMFVGMLFLTFVLIKDQKIKEMVASNVCLLIVILILWFSDDTFHYIQNTGMLLIFVGAMVIAELFGGFWGRKFARDHF